MVAIVECESDFTHYTKEGKVLTGRVDPQDIGVAQINMRHHPGAEAASLWGNLAYARDLFDAEGERPWVCRKNIAMK